TITQQLIKNTHLTNKKSFDRKFKEMKLAKQLEKEFSKDEILEMYLNILYFGKGVYGIKNATIKFFNKLPSDVTLAEACALAGIVKNPKKYNPIDNYNNCIARKNLVLNVLLSQDKISKKMYETAVNEDIVIKNTLKYNNNDPNSYLSAIYTQASAITKLSKDELKNGGYTIDTYLNLDAQNIINRFYNQTTLPKNLANATVDYLSFIIDNNNGSIIALDTNFNGNLFKLKRMPASTLKPFSVYLPAIENNFIFPSTKVLDEHININGYSPNNFNNQFNGWVSYREALATSLNIPAVKLLNEIGVDLSLNYLNKFKFNPEKSDNNLSLALGAMTNGVNPFCLANAYATLANEGNQNEVTLIKSITNKNGKIIYKHNAKYNQIINKSSAYIMTDMLRSTTKIGTARILDRLDMEIASKTGTLGTENDNSDCYNISYTKNHTFFNWIGNFNNDKQNNLNINLTGGGFPTQLCANVVENFYLQNNTAGNFIKPNNVVYLPIDKDYYNQNYIYKANITNNQNNYDDLIRGENNYINSNSLQNNNNFSKTLAESNSNCNYYSLESNNNFNINSLQNNNDFSKALTESNNLISEINYVNSKNNNIIGGNLDIDGNILEIFTTEQSLKLPTAPKIEKPTPNPPNDEIKRKPWFFDFFNFNN
ncbi:MAG: transglycosylase domain-containing protein, partial [Clostridia bacterium]